MNNQFDELTKSMAQAVTRRGALKKFGLGLAGMALACFGLMNKAEAAKLAKYGQPCATNSDCHSGFCNSYGWCGCTSARDCPVKTYCNLGVCIGAWA
jgi:hypothetical protein